MSIFKNIDLSKASSKEAVIDINGFKDPAHRLKNVQLPTSFFLKNARVVINDAEKVKFTAVKWTGNAKPEYLIANGTDIIY